MDDIQSSIIFISPSLLKANFTRYRILVRKLFSFNTLFYSFLASLVSDENCSEILTLIPLQVRRFSFLTSLRIFSLILVFCNVNMIGLDVDFVLYLSYLRLSEFHGSLVWSLSFTFRMFSAMTLNVSSASFSLFFSL